MQGPHEKKLLNHLLSNYNTLERPVANESEALQVRFGLTLQQIIDVVRVCVKHNYFEISCVRFIKIKISYRKYYDDNFFIGRKKSDSYHKRVVKFGK